MDADDSLPVGTDVLVSDSESDRGAVTGFTDPTYGSLVLNEEKRRHRNLGPTSLVSDTRRDRLSFRQENGDYESASARRLKDDPQEGTNK